MICLPQKDKTYYLTNLSCWGSGLLLRAGVDALVDVGGYGTAIGGAGSAVGAGVGIFGATTGNIPAAAVGGAITFVSAPLAAGGATVQGVGAVASFIGGESSRNLVRNASAAVINRIPLAPDWLKSGLKYGAKYLADRVPDVRTCHAER